jgi:4-hydroxyphenylpyruvate dioxygenase
MRTSAATVCLSGSLVEKLYACAAAGLDGVEIFEPDLVVSESGPEEIRALAKRLGLSLDLYQPFRDFEGVTPELLADNLRRAEAKFALMQRMGIKTILVCSNVATATIDSDEVSANQLRALGDLAEAYDVRVAFEALAWGRFVDDYRRSWRIVERADHPRIGLCLDSFHILSRGHDPAGIEQIPGEKIFYLQLADAPALSMDVLSWSRHYRLFPGEGAWDLAAFVSHVLCAGYSGPLSLEVFNDIFRQTDVAGTAAHARRSLVWLEDQVARRQAAGRSPAAAGGESLVRLPRTPSPAGLDFVEIKAENTSAVEETLGQLGFIFRGQHRTKPVRLWSAGQARVVLNEQYARDEQPHLAALGFDVSDLGGAVARAKALQAPPVYRRTYAGEVALEAVRAPDGTEIFLCPSPEDGLEPEWTAEFEHGESRPGGSGAVQPARIDHVNLVQRWQEFDEAVLFYTSVLGLDASVAVEVAGPTGLVRSQVMRTADGSIRVPLNVAPPVLENSGLPQHVAFSTDRIVDLARAARDRGLEFLTVSDNYYDDLVARFDLAPETVAQLHELGLLYDREAGGEFVHFYTATLGEVFFEVVQRRGGYDGYGAANAPVRLAAQRAAARRWVVGEKVGRHWKHE